MFNNIINKSQMNSLTKLDQEICQIRGINKHVLLIPIENEIKISRTKNIKKFKEFPLTNYDLLKNFEKNFIVKYRNRMKFKFLKNKKDILLINDNYLHHSLLL